LPVDWVVVGLGNPGLDYHRTRHNSGADTVALLAERHGGALKRDGRIKVLADTVRVGQHRVLLGFPQTYYNDSGLAVGGLLRRHDLEPDRLVVVHDELDLPPGRIKVKFGGGLAGNKGLASIKAHLGTDAFARVRIGVGKPPGRQQGADHVLRRPGKAERTELDITIEEAADAVEAVVAEGVDAAMQRYNARTPDDQVE
jgi:PTH1 family peptidyl-tRNA hydrolase